jgi:tRNA A-37 threonylcarbamoyl transferase component Bud32
MNINNYGYMFNEITIINNVFSKKSKNELGKRKINSEIEFYLYIYNNNIDFPMPKLIDYIDGNLSIKYISNSHTITHLVNKHNVFEYITNVKMHLNKIHTIQKDASSEIIANDLKTEIHTKVLDRYNEYKWDSDTLYNSIKTVNKIQFKNVNYYCDVIYTKLNNYLNKRNHYNLIHGDVHLGNILLDENKNIIFIDPRGYFGNSKLFGLYEYDYAKLLFGLSGYSIFDNTDINELSIIDGNFDIEFIKSYEYVFEIGVFDEITKLFCLSIWLGNNSCFLNINKKITSLMIAYYYCEKYLDKC